MSSVVDTRHTSTLPLNAPFTNRARRSWTVADYHRMGEMGLLRKHDRVELIAGDIVEMAPIGPEHAGYVSQLITLFAHRLYRTAIVTSQNPVFLSEYDEPQPDIAVLRWRDDFYKKAHPQPDDVLLLIEVGDSSVRDDRVVKIPRYAHYGVMEVWLLDLPQRRLEVYRDPDEAQYRHIMEHRTGTVSPVALPMMTIDLAELFPAPHTHSA